MNTYQFTVAPFSIRPTGVLRNQDNAHIPLDPDNTDYAQFLKDWEAGAEVLNPDGTPVPYSEAAVTALAAA